MVVDGAKSNKEMCYYWANKLLSLFVRQPASHPADRPTSGQDTKEAAAERTGEKSALLMDVQSNADDVEVE